MLSLNEKLSEVQLFSLRATFHALPLFYWRTKILRTYAGKNYVTLEISATGGGSVHILSKGLGLGFEKRIDIEDLEPYFEHLWLITSFLVRRGIANS